MLRQTVADIDGSFRSVLPSIAVAEISLQENGQEESNVRGSYED